MIYEIYVNGFSKPGWTYKTYKGAERRLDALAKLNGLRLVTVFVWNSGGPVNPLVLPVKLSCDKWFSGWEVVDGEQGIPTERNTFMLAKGGQR
jgi:hypothetical protein